MKLKIRKAGVNDVPAVHGLVAEATRRGKILKRSRLEVQKAINHFWVAEEAGKLVACCALEIYNKKLAEIRSLAVQAGREKQGIASRLVEACLREARRRRIYEVLVITNRENIFRRHGFSEQLQDQKALFTRP
ncbi:MAG: hypothetical protein A2901_08435 [Elusimicrobia bacterium RIFCSPLOWO2_01_FULL_54_10]|nr:MAG: hypothetical protein A2901_08435 [Elusimicrobia bacterium RIFCSPLOWO2_01_FULL_54_10]